MSDSCCYAAPAVRKRERGSAIVEMRIVEFPEEFKKLAGVMAYSYEARYHGCSQALLLTFQELLGLEDELTLKAASPLCSGVALMGHTCGALIAGVMVMGMKYGRARPEEGIDGILRGMRPATRLVRRMSPVAHCTGVSFNRLRSRDSSRS